MAHRRYEDQFTAARQISADNVRRYLVWTVRGPATTAHLYEADSGAEAIAMARADLAKPCDRTNH